MMKHMKQLITITLTALSLFILCGAVQVQAAAYINSENSIDKNDRISIGGNEFITGNTYYYTSDESGRRVNIYQKKNGVYRRIIASALPDFTTNGRSIYYAKSYKAATDSSGTVFYNKIYRYDIKTGKKTKMVKGGKELFVYTASGKYLYYGKGGDYPGGDAAYVLNTKSGKSKLLYNFVLRSSLLVAGGRVILMEGKSDVSNSAIYVFKKSGSGRRKAGKGLTMAVKGSYIYYYKCKYTSSGSVNLRVYRAKIKSGKGKGLTGWLSSNSIPQKYAFISEG